MPAGVDVDPSREVCLTLSLVYACFLCLQICSDLTPFVSLLLALMIPTVESSTPEFDDQAFIPASDSLQELLTASSLCDGSGTKTVTEPLLLWLDRYGGPIVQASIDGTLTLCHRVDS